MELYASGMLARRKTRSISLAQDNGMAFNYSGHDFFSVGIILLLHKIWCQLTHFCVKLQRHRIFRTKSQQTQWLVETRECYVNRRKKQRDIRVAGEREGITQVHKQKGGKLWMRQNTMFDKYTGSNC